MSTIYVFNDELPAQSAAVASADIFLMHDASTGLKARPTYSQVMAGEVATVSSNGAAIAGTYGGIASMGTSTAAILSAATIPGLIRTFHSNTSTVAYTITASGSSFGTGAVMTVLGGGAVTFQAISTSRWALIGYQAGGSTLNA